MEPYAAVRRDDVARNGSLHSRAAVVRAFTGRSLLASLSVDRSQEDIVHRRVIDFRVAKSLGETTNQRFPPRPSAGQREHDWKYQHKRRGGGPWSVKGDGHRGSGHPGHNY